MGWDDEEIDWRIRKAFVETSPVSDVAFPLIAMTQGLQVRARLKEHFDEKQVSDLWLPFFCISSNLTSGAYQQHSGAALVRLRALRASIAIPGLLPPVTQDNNVLVDGAVMKNFPADVLRTMHLGPIVGIDVTRGRSITADDVARPASVWRWIFSGEWRKFANRLAADEGAATVSTSSGLDGQSAKPPDVLRGYRTEQCRNPRLQRFFYDPAGGGRPSGHDRGARQTDQAGGRPAAAAEPGRSARPLDFIGARG